MVPVKKPNARPFNEASTSRGKSHNLKKGIHKKLLVATANNANIVQYLKHLIFLETNKEDIAIVFKNACSKWIRFSDRMDVDGVNLTVSINISRN